MTPKNIADIIHNIIDALPPGFKNLPVDMQKNLRGALHGAFDKLDLVTREEFDAQCAVLLRTREKLEALEKKIADRQHTQ
ncbi:MAG: accessory factor UbiK family protein [Coxiellaceae bacterium]|nr:accessory factor UbiK family protein [Coxiellaceae bacterium]